MPLSSPLIDLCHNRQIKPAAWKEIPEPPVKEVLSFHQQMDAYAPTPLHSLKGLAEKLEVHKVWVKDESHRFGLNAYKGLGGAYALAKYLAERFGIEEPDFDKLHASRLGPEARDLVFATMTDGNHGRGVAFMAKELGYSSEIYVPAEMVPARKEAIRKAGGRVTVFEGSYDDAARQIARDAKEKGWQVISDTAWEGYTRIPQWIVEGYTTLFEEAHIQVNRRIPTHIIIQAGVGSLAASLIRYFRSEFQDEAIKIILTEPKEACCFYTSAEINDGNPHPYPDKVQTLMAGLACAEPNPEAWDLIRDGSDFMMACSDEIALLGMQRYYYPEKGDPKIISGEAGAVTMGALFKILSDPQYSVLKKELNLNANSRILLINTEGNTDPVHFDQVIRQFQGSFKIY